MGWAPYFLAGAAARAARFQAPMMMRSMVFCWRVVRTPPRTTAMAVMRAIRPASTVVSGGSLGWVRITGCDSFGELTGRGRVALCVNSGACGADQGRLTASLTEAFQQVRREVRVQGGG